MKIGNSLAGLILVTIALAGCGGGDGSSNTTPAGTSPAVATPTISISAAPASVASGDATTITWTTTNVTSCAASGAWTGSQATSGSQVTVALTTTSTYSLSCSGAGGSATADVTINVTPAIIIAPPVVNLTASPAQINTGASSTLTWSSSDATGCIASGAWSGTRLPAGSEATGPLPGTSAFTLTCTGGGGTATTTATVVVNPPPAGIPTLSLIAVPSTVNAGAAATLQWNTTNVSNCTATGGWSGAKAPSGSQQVGPLAASTNFALACTGPGGSTQQTVVVTVFLPPTVSFAAAPTSVASGGATTLTWSSANASSCAAGGGWSGAKSTNGSELISGLTSATTFTLTCTGPGGSAQQSTAITILPAPIASISAAPTSIASGGSTTLTWSSVNATSCTASGGWSGTKATTGSELISSLNATTTFTLNCTGSGGATQSSANVTVESTDTTVPTVSISSPSGGATISGSTALSAQASDNVGVVGVQFKVDGTNIGAEDFSAPYSIPWDTVTAANGAHSLTAVARDLAGNAATSATVTITVNNPDIAPPSVGLSSPANGATVSTSVTVAATASDNIGVTGVQFKLDGSNLGAEDISAPYSTTWDTLAAANGTHALTAVARDQAGNTATSSAVTVTVNNVDTTPPTIAFTSPASGATVSGTVTVAATASDNVGVLGVQFKLDGNNLGAEDLTSPYSTSWTTTSATNGGHTLTAIARDAAAQTTTASRTVTVSNAAGTPLSINGNQHFQTIDGFGVSANAASWDNGELVPAIDTLVANGSTIWRVVMEMADWEATNDNADPNTFNWTYYNSIYSSPRFEELWNTLSYLNTKGITSTLMLNFMGRGPAWMGGADLPTSLEDEWVETVASVAYYARNNRNIQFGLFSPNNEMDWDGIEGIRMNAAQNARVLRKLSQKLDSLGMGDLRLVGPDTAQVSAGVDSYIPAMMADSAVIAKVDHFALHSYSGDSGNADSAIKNSAYPDRNFWMTELSLIEHAMANIGQGAAAILVWDGYDSVYNHAILAGRGSNPPNDAGNGPALLSYSTSTHLYTARKAFYEFAQLFKYVPAGSVRVAATESNGNVTLYAFHHPVSGRVTLVGRNTGGSVQFSGTLSNLPTVPVFGFYRTDASVNMQRGSDVTVTNGAFSFTAPANSIFTLTGIP